MHHSLRCGYTVDGAERDMLTYERIAWYACNMAGCSTWEGEALGGN